MNFSSKSFIRSEPTGCAYVGILTSGEPIIFVSGIVDRSDCEWAMTELDELIHDGEQRIVVDFSGVTFASRQWLDFETQSRKSLNPAISIVVRESVPIPAAQPERKQVGSKARFGKLLVTENA